MKRTYLSPWYSLAVLPLAFALSSYESAKKPSGGHLLHMAKLPGVVVESSGLELAAEANTYWTHNDAGNTAVLYRISEKGKLLETVPLSGASNTDWEDLAQDSKGFLYVGDTGNNSNKRQDLHIYKVSPKNGFKTQKIIFKYEDHPARQPEKRDRNFDCEAFFWHNGKLYLISKDRGASRYAKLYELPDSPGTHTARLLKKQELPGQVTSADLSPDGRHLAVLTYGKIYLYPVAKGTNQFFGQKPQILELMQAGQAEAVLFKDNKTLVLSNEEGNLFKFNL